VDGSLVPDISMLPALEVLAQDLKAVPRQGLHSEVGVESLLQHAARILIELVLQFALRM
jgi:hypothetical protein